MMLNIMLINMNDATVKVKNLLVSIKTSLSCSPLDELEASLSCAETPAAELIEPAAIALCY